MTPEAKRALSLRMMGNTIFLGRRHGQAAKAKLSAFRRGTRLDPEVVRRIADKNRGRRVAPEVRARISATLKAKYESDPVARLELARRAPGPSETRPERAVQAALETIGLIFEKQFHFPRSAFAYDFAIPSRKLLIEVDGCYWHGCKLCGFRGKPVNKRNDRAKNARARKLGWELMRIPEHAVKDGSFLPELESRLG